MKMSPSRRRCSARSRNRASASRVPVSASLSKLARSPAIKNKKGTREGIGKKGAKREGGSDAPGKRPHWSPSPLAGPRAFQRSLLRKHVASPRLLVSRVKDGESSAHILVSRKESLTARRPAARRWPPTLLCHSCDRPLVSWRQRWVSRVLRAPVGSSR